MTGPLSDTKVIWVFDNGYWRQDKDLYLQVEKASWEKVILDEKLKKELTSVAGNFFDSKNVYEDLGVPWKRGLMVSTPLNALKIIADIHFSSMGLQEMARPCPSKP